MESAQIGGGSVKYCFFANIILEDSCIFKDGGNGHHALLLLICYFGSGGICRCYLFAVFSCWAGIGAVVADVFCIENLAFEASIVKFVTV